MLAAASLSAASLFDSAVFFTGATAHRGTKLAGAFFFGVESSVAAEVAGEAAAGATFGDVTAQRGGPASTFFAGDGVSDFDSAAATAVFFGVTTAHRGGPASVFFFSSLAAPVAPAPAAVASALLLSVVEFVEEESVDGEAGESFFLRTIRGRALTGDERAAAAVGDFDEAVVDGDDGVAAAAEVEVDGEDELDSDTIASLLAGVGGAESRFFRTIRGRALTGVELGVSFFAAPAVVAVVAGDAD